jgi:hypothetical protein
MASALSPLFLSGCSAFLNIFFYDDYYMIQKQHTLIDIYDKINRVYDGGARLSWIPFKAWNTPNGSELPLPGATGQDIKYNTIFRGSAWTGS